MGSQTSSEASKFASNSQVFRPHEDKLKNVVIPVDASKQAEAAFLCNCIFMPILYYRPFGVPHIALARCPRPNSLHIGTKNLLIIKHEILELISNLRKLSKTDRGCNILTDDLKTTDAKSIH